jgi:hypothetical protein
MHTPSLTVAEHGANGSLVEVAPAGLAAKSTPDMAVNEMIAIPNRFILCSLEILISHRHFSCEVLKALQEASGRQPVQGKPRSV